jgi:hypothetical protein
MDENPYKSPESAGQRWSPRWSRTIVRGDIAIAFSLFCGASVFIVLRLIVELINRFVMHNN